ncbi:MAG: CAP domain-containing protein [Marinifilaceae bacterium]|jgi:uncharacterized protein YkwD|nr:CAP domain-containing protein [Marinifilaceae bacterium]
MKILKNFSLILLCILSLCACDSDDENSNLDPNSPEANIVKIDQTKLLRLVNEARSNGVTCKGVKHPAVEKIKWNNKLEEMALNHSKVMYQKAEMKHNFDDEPQLGERAKIVEYNYKALGENIAYNQKTEEEVIQAWLNSPGHCANIMNPNFKEMGISKVGPYWCQNFGTQLKIQN